MRHMTEWPKRFVGKSIVVAVDILGRKPDTLQRIGGFIGRHSGLAVLICRLFVCRPGAIRNPCATGCVHDALERRNGAAGGDAITYLAINHVMDIWLAVGSNINRASAQGCFYKFFEPLLGPWA